MTYDHNESISSARLRTGTALTILAGLLLIASGAVKLYGVPKVIHELQQYGFVHTIALVAVLEIASGLLLLVPRTRSLGLVFASAFMGGAIATHVEHAEAVQIAPAAFVLGLVWIGVWLKHPVALWSF
jgi:uncharacterized membrane protein YphA (DoxX/SURF4 family)